MNNEVKLIARLRRNNRKIRRNLCITKLLFSGLFVFCVACVVYIMYLSGVILTKDLSLSRTISENEKLQNEYEQIENENKELQNQLAEISSISVDLDEQNKKLVDQINETNSVLKRYEEREELFDQYEFAIIRQDKSRTDIKYSDIDTLESLALAKNMGPDAVDLVLAFAMNESEGYSKVKNPHSTATGLCGLLAGTAKYTYEIEMGNGKGTYHHSMAYDGTLNLKMSLYYIDYLAKNNGRSTLKTIYSYRGATDQPYMIKLDRRLSTEGKSIYTIRI